MQVAYPFHKTDRSHSNDSIGMMLSVHHLPVFNRFFVEIQDIIDPPSWEKERRRETEVKDHAQKNLSGEKECLQFKRDIVSECAMKYSTLFLNFCVLPMDRSLHNIY